MKKIEYNIRCFNMEKQNYSFVKAQGYFLGEKYGFQFAVGWWQERKWRKRWVITELFTGLNVNDFTTRQKAKEWFENEFEKEISKNRLDDTIKWYNFKKPANEKIKI